MTGFSAGADIHIDLIGTRRTIADITSRDGAWLLGICGGGARWGYAEMGRDGVMLRWGDIGIYCGGARWGHAEVGRYGDMRRWVR